MSFGVQLFAADEEFELLSPFGMSNKTSAKLPKMPVRKFFCLNIVRVNVNTTTNFCSIVPQIVVESLAFTEVLKSRDNTAPVVFFAGMCTNRKHHFL